MKRSRLLLPLAVLALVAGCGGSGGDPDADPAAIVPARAPVYLEATLKADDDFEAVAKKLTGAENPSAELKRLFERAANEGGGDFKWDEDVKPWIGDRVGLYVMSVKPDGEDADAAFVAPTEDPDKAQEFLEKDIAEKGDSDEQAPKVSERTYKDTKYKVDSANDEAVAILKDYAVFGTEPAVKGAIDAVEGEGLSDADAFKKARDQIDDDALGFGYVRLSTLFSSLGPQGAAARQLLGQSGDTIAFSVDAEKDEISVETASIGVKGGGQAGPGSVLATLPGDAWAAVGTADLGGQVDRQLQQFSQLGALGGVNVDQALDQFRSQTGVDVREDLLSWMGDAGIYVSGSGLADIGGALVVQSKDPAKSEAAVAKIARLVRRLGQGQLAVRELKPSGGVDFDRGIQLRASGLPLPISIVSADDRFVIAVGGQALEGALKPAEALKDNAGYKEAAGRLGEGIEPQFFLNMDPIRRLLDESGAWQRAGAEADKVKRALEQLTTVAAGSKREGDVQKGELVIGVK
jgi:hypothetical protein